MGKKEAFQQVDLKFIFPIYTPPFFKPALEKVTLVVDIG